MSLKPIIWENCYDASWKGVITDASFQHPAKFARGLIERIFDYCLEEGYLKRGDVVGDCFGGIGTGGITAAYRGLNWIGCELEPKFVALAEANFELHRSKLSALGYPAPRIIQGDSRKFHVMIGGNDAIISSPPYADSVDSSRSGIDWDKAARPERWGKQETRNGCQAAAAHEMSYGQTHGQIGRLKAGAVDGVISSPPFLATRGGDSGGALGKDTPLGKRHWQAGLAGGQHKANIETLKEGSVASTASQDTDQKYGCTEGQIAKLKPGIVDGVVSSPPYGQNVEPGRCGNAEREMALPPADRFGRSGHGAGYGKSPGQIGDRGDETYFEAMATVYRACYRSIKSGGVIVLVLKDYVSKKKRVPLCDDTDRLLAHIGFIELERIHAMLVKEVHHDDMFIAAGTKSKTSKKSFFRRLAEANGSPEINYEEVLIFRRP